MTDHLSAAKTLIDRASVQVDATQIPDRAVADVTRAASAAHLLLLSAHVHALAAIADRLESIAADTYTLRPRNVPR